VTARIKTPTAEQMETAAAWLDCNEGSGDEAESCAAVAEWLREQAAAKQLRAVATEAGVPLGRLRAAMKQERSRG